MAAYEVQLATMADCPDMVDVYYDAFSDDPIMGNFDANVDPRVKREVLTKKYRLYMDNVHLTGSHFFKCVEISSGYVISSDTMTMRPGPGLELTQVKQ